MKILSSLILSFSLIFLWSCSDSGEPKIEGCMDSNACNYSIENTHDDGSCSYAEDNYDCNGNCTAGEVADCAGVCGGDAIDDACGTCEGSITNATQCDCPGGIVMDCAGVCGGNAVDDCASVCGGNAVLTDCGCGEAASDETTGCCEDGLSPNDEVQDCAEECGGSAVVDECDECGGSGLNSDGCCGNSSSCVHYSTEIQPIFNTNCTGCHGGSGGLNLGSYSTLMSGGNSGAVVISGNGSGSRLIQKLQGTASDSQMPKGGSPLDETTINLIKTWIDEGALDN